MKSRWLIGVVVALAVFPMVAFAAHRTPNTDVWDPSILAGPLTVCTGNYIPSQVVGPQMLPPCADLCDFMAEIIQIIYFIIGVGIWILVPIMVGYAGVRMILARGNPGSVSEARKAALGAVIGVAIMLCAWLIVSTFVALFGLAGSIGVFGGSGGNCLAPPPAQTQTGSGNN